MARPIDHAAYEDADMAVQAAILALGIAQSRSFIDGNKRTALVARRITAAVFCLRSAGT